MRRPPNECCMEILIQLTGVFFFLNCMHTREHVQTYNEFLEALCAIACFFAPDPYVCLEQRLEVFFLTKVVDHVTPSLLRKFKQRGLNNLEKACSRSGGSGRSPSKNKKK